MKQLLIIIFALMAVTGLKGENYPYKSDYLWVTVPDHANWLYKTGEQASIEVQFYRYGMPCDGEVYYAIGNDLMETDTKGVLKLRESTLPSWCRCQAYQRAKQQGLLS